jgi:hypothetical protein
MIIYTRNTAVSGKKKMSRSTARINAAMITRYAKLIKELLPSGIISKPGLPRRSLEKPGPATE